MSRNRPVEFWNMNHLQDFLTDHYRQTGGWRTWLKPKMIVAVKNILHADPTVAADDPRLQVRDDSSIYPPMDIQPDRHISGELAGRPGAQGTMLVPVQAPASAPAQFQAQAQAQPPINWREECQQMQRRNIELQAQADAHLVKYNNSRTHSTRLEAQIANLNTQLEQAIAARDRAIEECGRLTFQLKGSEDLVESYTENITERQRIQDGMDHEERANRQQLRGTIDLTHL
ncbi:hypothetical protein VTL71DRAFT_5742 [Oculimacula yallundae]|uniref:Uncharacterized protein n=1 Tax=Oculimacula yallundae TaxID=86028 RepID=A0ABR4BYC8_9HELO